MNTRLTQLVVLIITSGVCSLQAQTVSEYEALTSLRQAWAESRDAATKPIDEKYQNALVSLKDKLTKGGQLEQALQVDSELRRITSEFATGFLGTWINQNGKFSIHADNTAQGGAFRGKWEVKSGHFLLTWSNGYVHDYTLKQSNKDELVGSDISPSGKRTKLTCKRVIK